ncbi:MAG: MBL fold metallo-hydrolase [Gaiellaceae bacterium]
MSTDETGSAIESLSEGARGLLLEPGSATEVAPRVHVMPDRRVNLVPNVGIVVGDAAALIVDTAMGPINGAIVLEEARRVAGDKPLYVTVTHFHPEHGFGAQALADHATLIYNRAQIVDLFEQGPGFIEMFSGFAPEIAELLAPVELVRPRIGYDGECEIDLGGVTVLLRERGGAHTKGDQIVLVPDSGVLFAGDLVENRFFPIVFGDDANGPEWIKTLDELGEVNATVVVPGHGETAGPELISEQRAYLVAVGEAVKQRIDSGQDVEAIATELGPEIEQQYSSWENSEWIDFAIRNFHRELS